MKFSSEGSLGELFFDFRKFRYLCWVVAFLTGAASLAELWFDKRLFLVSYLEAYWWWTGITLGCLTLWMIHSLSGGQWGDPIGKVARAASYLLPLMALLFIPIALGTDTLYFWRDKSLMASNEVLTNKVWYLNLPAFLWRAGIYYVIWGLLLFQMAKRSKVANDDPDHPGTQKLQNLAGPGFIIMFFTGAFASVDWLLSTDRYFYSTIWGALTNLGIFTTTLAFCILISFWYHRARTGKSPSEISDIKRNDIANLMLLALMLWMYAMYIQWIIITAGQTKPQIAWYNGRFMGGWQWFAGAVVCLHFGVPFVCLLFRKIKRSVGLLTLIAAIVFFFQWVNVVWLVAPSYSPMRIDVHWTMGTLSIAMGAIYMGLIALLLEKGVAPFPRGHREEVAHYDA